MPKPWGVQFFLFLIFKKFQFHHEIFKNSSFHFSSVKKFAYMPDKTSIWYVKKIIWFERELITDERKDDIDTF